MRGDPRIGGQQFAERLALHEGVLRGVIHRVMRVLPADGGAEVEHHRLGHDQAAAEIEVGAHPRRVEAQAAHDLRQPAEHVAGGDAGARFGGVHHQAGGAVGLVFGGHRFQRQRHHGADFGGGGDDVLAEFRIALLRHGGTADGAGRDRFLDLAELGLHQGVDFAADLAAGGGEQAEQQ